MTAFAAFGNRLVQFLRAARGQFLGASVVPVLVGTTLPFWLRPPGFHFHYLGAVEALVAVVFIHVGSNLANDYYDFLSGADRVGPDGRGLSGGSGLIPDVFPPVFFLRSAILCFAIGAAFGLHLNALSPGNLILLLGVVGLACGYLYTAPPMRFAYRGLGELVVGLCFGILPVLGAYYVQAGVLSWRVAVASLPTTVAVVLVLWVNEIADFENDREAGKRTLVVALGKKRAARSGVLTLCILVYATLFLAVFTASLIPLTLVAVLAFGYVRATVAVSWKHYDRPRLFAGAQEHAVKLHLALGIVVALSALAAVGN